MIISRSEATHTLERETTPRMRSIYRAMGYVPDPAASAREGKAIWSPPREPSLAERAPTADERVAFLRAAVRAGIPHAIVRWHCGGDEREALLKEARRKGVFARGDASPVARKTNRKTVTVVEEEEKKHGPTPKPPTDDDLEGEEAGATADCDDEDCEGDDCTDSSCACSCHSEEESDETAAAELAAARLALAQADRALRLQARVEDRETRAWVKRYFGREAVMNKARFDEVTKAHVHGRLDAKPKRDDGSAAFAALAKPGISNGKPDPGMSHADLIRVAVLSSFAPEISTSMCCTVPWKK